MPELPEVETMRRGLNEILGLGGSKKVTIKDIEFKRADIRRKMPKAKLKKLVGQKLEPIQRRAKYLLFPTSAGSLLNHLGMTGYWRELKTKETLKHDHFLLFLSNGKTLIFNDARRFGVIDFVAPNKELASPWLQHLGMEPLTDEFSGDYLYEKLRKRKGYIKNIIMDQKLVVGVGNIYASEALFLAHVHPMTSGARISKKKAQAIVLSIKAILNKALHSGGTTIRDFRQAGGESGYFARELMVYGRAGEPCKSCGSLVKTSVLGGRSTFWCPKCQKK